MSCHHKALYQLFYLVLVNKEQSEQIAKVCNMDMIDNSHEHG